MGDTIRCRPLLCSRKSKIYLKHVSALNAPLFEKMKNDFDDYKIKLNVATARLFEQLTGKSFFKMDDGDSLQLAYCSLVANNDLTITFETFLKMIESQKIADWLIKEMDKISKFQEQLQYVKKNKIEQLNEGAEEELVSTDMTVSDFASALIINYGMDPHYVNYDMALYEMEDYFYAAEMKRRADLEEKRIFTYLSMLPHLDPKKKTKPEDILPFPWETKSRKANAENDLKNRADMIMATFAAMNGTKEEESNG